jgi:hypothetical protein
MVTTLIENTDTSVTMVSSRSMVNAPRTAIAPIASGSEAAAKLPKMTMSSTSRIGIDSPSALAMSFRTVVLISSKIAAVPVTWTSRPGAARSSWIASYDLARAGSSAPANSSTAYVACRSVETIAGECVCQ